MRIAKVAALAIALVVISGCAATGPLYTEVAASFPAVPKDKGRIYFFRPDTMFGAAITSDIHLNGRVVGKSERASFFYVDEKPGKCTVATSTEVEKQLTFTLARGETRYVKTSVSFGALVGRINPKLVGATEAKTEIVELHYTGGQKK
jgi:hypothetical protein